MELTAFTSRLGEGQGRLQPTSASPAGGEWVFVLGDAPDSSRLKIMSFPKRPGGRPDQKFIHSSIGISYLTLRVADMGDALARLKKHKVKLLGQTPTPLGGKMRITVFHDPDGNFIELIGPLND